jgi:hypothetical protein
MDVTEKNSYSVGSKWVYIFSRRKAKEEILDWMTYQIYSATTPLTAAPLAVSQGYGKSAGADARDPGRPL